MRSPSPIRILRYYHQVVTHEYVIALNGQVRPMAPADDSSATAIGWAADVVLAVGSDTEVEAISRGDSTFLDLAGCLVTPLPDDVDRAIAALSAADSGPDVERVLVERGVLPPDAALEPGARADLAFWSAPAKADGSSSIRLVATLRGGVFGEGDARCGPFTRRDR